MIKLRKGPIQRGLYKDMCMMEEDFFGSKRDDKIKTLKKLGPRIIETRKTARTKKF